MGMWKKISKRGMWWVVGLLFSVMTLVFGCAGTLKEEGKAPESFAESVVEASAEQNGEETKGTTISEDGEYILKDEVALYLHEYGHLPGNYITKKEAQELGWDNKKGNLSEVAPGKSIGGSHFGNYEGALPEKKGRKYYECDLEYEGGYRGAKRLIYSNDGLIFYTEDHYQTFEQLY
ncbi:MAG: ribonuclease [Lachnospiraceae bacterium]|nr:ribonuclease [Lachnospiraceae bacterium]MCI9283280.1 ribonuclease [Lachnospiraceae bacterium]